MKLNQYLVLFFLLTTTPHIYASGFNYSVIDIGYAELKTDFGATDVDGDGYFLSGSADIDSELALTGGYSKFSFDFGIDTKESRIGIDYHSALAESTDLVVGMSIVKSKISDPLFPTREDTGKLISIGVRQKIGNDWEISLGASRLDIFDNKSITYGAVLYIALDENIWGIGYGISEDTRVISIGLRL